MSDFWKPGRALAGLAACIVVACGGSAGEEGAGTRVAFITVAQSSISAIGTAGASVVSEPTIWQALWTRHTANQLPPPALPAVDFGREQVLAYFAGGLPSGCDSAAIVGVVDHPALRVVRVQVSRAQPGMVCPAVITTPAHFIRVPAAPLPVEFRVE